MSSAGTTLPGTMWRSSEQNPKYKTSGSPRRDGEGDGDGDVKPARHRPLPPEDASASTMFHGRAFNVKWSDKTPNVNPPRTTTVQPRTVRWSDKEPLAGRETVTTDLGGVLIHTAKPYEQVVAERDMLIGQEETYRKRINELETENAHILLDYDTLYKESNMLREKLEMGTEGEYVESYQRIYADREILREAEVAYKRRIDQLQREARDMVENFESLYAENNVMRAKTRDLENKLETIDRLDDIKKMNELEKKTKQQEKTIRTMGYERESAIKEKTEIEAQNVVLKGSIADINKRNLLLERENEALKRGFMALGQTDGNKWKDDTILRRKTKREEEVEKQMQQDLKKYKTSCEKLTITNNELQKTVIEMETKTSMLEKDKNSLEDRLFAMTSEQAKRTPSGVKRREAANLEKKEQKMEDLLKQVNDLLIENTEIKVKCDLLTKDKLHLETKIKEISSEKRETDSSVRRKKETEKELEEQKKQVTILTEKVQQHNLVKADLERNIKKLEDEIKSLSGTGKSLVQEQKDQTDQVKSLNKQIISLHEEIRKLTEENGKIKQESVKYTDELEYKISLLHKDTNLLEHEKQATERHVKSDESNYKAKMESLQQELEYVQVDLRVTKPKLENALAKVEKLKHKKKALSEALESKTTEVNELRDIMRKDKDVFNELAKSERENAMLKREIKDQDTSFEREKNKLNMELEELLRNQEFMNVSLTEHKVRLDMLQAEKVDVRTENVRLIKVNERQSNQIGELNTEMQIMKETEQMVTKELKEEINTLTEKLQNSETALIQCKQELDTLTNEKDNQVNKLIKQLQKLKEERKLETKQLQDQSVSLRSEVARLKVFEERIESVELDLKGFVDKLQESEKKTKTASDHTLGTLGLVINEMKSENLANRMRAAQMEDNDIERHKLELDIKQDAINAIRKLKLENSRLLMLLEDKSSEEDARSEWSKKRNKYNEIVAQNKRLQEENKRVLDLYDQREDEATKSDVRLKNEHLRQLETKTASQAVEIGDLRRNIQENEAEIKTMKKHDTTSAQARSKRLITENKELKEELFKKDALITSLKDLESTKAKYHDISVNNQRLYIENQRLRENLEKSTDYKLEYKLAKASEQSLTEKQARSSEDKEKLKKDLTTKIKEAHAELMLHKENITTLKDRNKLLSEDEQRLKEELARKDDIILSLKEIETVREKFKQASANNKRLYDENVRLREILEQFAWNSDIEKAIQTSQSPNVKHLQKAVYIEGDNTLVESIVGNEKVGEAEETAPLKRLGKKNIKQNKVVPQPIPTLPAIEHEGDRLQGATYPNIPAYIKGTPVEVITIQKQHRKTTEELANTKKELEKRTNEVRRLKEKTELLKSEIARLKRETETKDSEVENRFNRESNLEHHNRRLQTEIQRLRDELNIQKEEAALSKPIIKPKPSRSEPDHTQTLPNDKRVRIQQVQRSGEPVTHQQHPKTDADTKQSKQLVPKRTDQWASKVNHVQMKQQPTVTPRKGPVSKSVNETDESKLNKSRSETKLNMPNSPNVRDTNKRPVTKRPMLKSQKST